MRHEGEGTIGNRESEIGKIRVSLGSASNFILSPRRDPFDFGDDLRYQSGNDEIRG
jgi:hypothetical protein